MEFDYILCGMPHRAVDFKYVRSSKQFTQPLCFVRSRRTLSLSFCVKRMLCVIRSSMVDVKRTMVGRWVSFDN